MPQRRVNLQIPFNPGGQIPASTGWRSGSLFLHRLLEKLAGTGEIVVP
jgi:hypothetical protein